MACAETPVVPYSIHDNVVAEFKRALHDDVNMVAILNRRQGGTTVVGRLLHWLVTGSFVREGQHLRVGVVGTTHGHATALVKSVEHTSPKVTLTPVQVTQARGFDLLVIDGCAGTMHSLRARGVLTGRYIATICDEIQDQRQVNAHRVMDRRWCTETTVHIERCPPWFTPADKHTALSAVIALPQSWDREDAVPAEDPPYETL